MSSFQRLLRATTKTAILALAFATLAAAPIVSAAQPQRHETPDPYFNPKNKSDILPPAHPPSIYQPKNGSWSPPRTDKNKPPVPLEIKTSAPNVGPSKSNPLQPSNAFSNSKPLSTNNAPITPRVASNPALPKTPKSSIIREMPEKMLTPKPPALGEADSDSNDFGAAANPKKSFEIGPAKTVSNPYTNGSKKPNLTKPVSESKSSNDFGSTSAMTISKPIEIQSSSAAKSTPGATTEIEAKPVSVTSNEPLGAYTAFEPTQLLAMVGNEPIFVGDLMFEVNQLLDQFMPGAPKNIKEKEGRKLVKRILPKFVDQKLLYVGVVRSLPDEADIESIIEQAAEEFDKSALPDMMKGGGFTNQNQLDAQLRVQGHSLRKMRESWAKDQLTKYFLTQQLQVNSEVTHQQLLDEYRKHQEDYAMPAKARWEQVMVRFDKAGTRKAAEEQIVELGNQVVYGANLSAIAKKSSHGFYASKGGQHDWTSKNALALKELDKAIFSLPVGELSDKIETRDGFHIVRVLERTDATFKPFLEAQVEIKKRLLDKKRDEAFKKHLEKLKDEIRVEYFDFNDELTAPSSASN